MTATIIETDLDHAVEDLTNPMIPCEGLTYIEYECPNEAVYKMESTCCGAQFNWCESCLFAFIEEAKTYEGWIADCVYCGTTVEISPNHVKVIGRIK